MQDLEGKTAVITGAASGIGLAMAHRFGEAGMKLVLADIEVTPLDVAAEELRAAGCDVATMVLDVRDAEQVTALEQLARDRYGSVDLLCNNAGVGSGGPIAGMDDIDVWRWVIDVDLWGVIYGCKIFLPGMIAQEGPSHIVNTASMAGLGSAPLMGPYNIAKYGVVALSETMSREMQMMQTGVGVSVLCPAFVQTAIASSRRNLPDELKSDEDRAAEEGAEPSETAAMVERLIASGLATEVVADAVHDAVVGNTFWILTHEESKPNITARAADIVDGVNPRPTFFS